MIIFARSHIISSMWATGRSTWSRKTGGKKRTFARVPIKGVKRPKKSR